MFNKTFIRVTKTQSINKVVKEHYLRDDISCGLEGCPKCQNPSDTNLINPVCQGAEQHAVLGSKPHILVMDTNIILHHLDTIEDSRTINLIKNVVVLQTVLDEIRGRNPGIYTRIRNIVASGRTLNRHFFVFSNEYHREAALTLQTVGESPNDRNDAAIRKAALWYAKHVSPPVQVVLLTNDRDNASKAAAEGLGTDNFMTMTLIDYIRGYKDTESLVSPPKRSRSPPPMTRLSGVP